MMIVAQNVPLVQRLVIALPLPLVVVVLARRLPLVPQNPAPHALVVNVSAQLQRVVQVVQTTTLVLVGLVHTVLVASVPRNHFVELVVQKTPNVVTPVLGVNKVHVLISEKLRVTNLAAHSLIVLPHAHSVRLLFVYLSLAQRVENLVLLQILASVIVHIVPPTNVPQQHQHQPHLPNAAHRV